MLDTSTVATDTIAYVATSTSQRQPNVVHGAFGFDRGAAFFLCLFATDLASTDFARARAALLAAARLSGDHGVC
jgi:hypothetical protein